MLKALLSEKFLISGLTVILLVVVGIVVWRWRAAQILTLANDNILAEASNNYDNNTPADWAPAANNNNKISPPVRSNNAVVLSAAADVRYEAAMEKYDYRIQFSECHGLIIPGNGTLALKQGSTVMLDNRDNASHIIKFAGQTYTVKAYNFALAKVKTTGDFIVTCDNKGAAQLLVQA